VISIIFTIPNPNRNGNNNPIVDGETIISIEAGGKISGNGEADRRRDIGTRGIGTNEEKIREGIRGIAVSD